MTSSPKNPTTHFLIAPSWQMAHHHAGTEFGWTQISNDEYENEDGDIVQLISDGKELRGRVGIKVYIVGHLSVILNSDVIQNKILQGQITTVQNPLPKNMQEVKVSVTASALYKLLSGLQQHPHEVGRFLSKMGSSNHPVNVLLEEYNREITELNEAIEKHKNRSMH